MPNSMMPYPLRNITRRSQEWPLGRVATNVHEKNVLAIGVGRKRHVDGSFHMLRKLFSLSMHGFFVLSSCEELHHVKVESERNES